MGSVRVLLGKLLERDPYWPAMVLKTFKVFETKCCPCDFIGISEIFKFPRRKCDSRGAQSDAERLFEY